MSAANKLKNVAETWSRLQLVDADLAADGDPLDILALSDALDLLAI